MLVLFDNCVVTMDCDKLITLVKDKPLLWDKNHSLFKNHIEKDKCWLEVAAGLIETWDELSTAEKKNLRELVKGRWKNIRACFSRELREQRNMSDQAARKRRKYRHYKQLTFLLPHAETRDSSRRSSASVLEDGDGESGSEEDELRRAEKATHQTKRASDDDELMDLLRREGYDTEEDSSRQADQTTRKTEIKIEKKRFIDDAFLDIVHKDERDTDEEDASQEDKAPKKIRRSCNEKLLEILQNKRVCEDVSNDQERLFALSLVPLLKAVPEGEKIGVQIKILQIFKDIEKQNQRYSQADSSETSRRKPRIVASRLQQLGDPSEPFRPPSASPQGGAPRSAPKSFVYITTSSEDTRFQSLVSNYVEVESEDESACVDAD